MSAARLLALGLAAVAIAACKPATDQPPEDPAAAVDRPTQAAAPQRKAGAATMPQPRLGAAIALSEWSKAPNRAACAPLALASDGGAPNAKARRANFGGGWGVAFDLPGRRSAFGFAGSGLLDGDRAPHSEKVEALSAQWPYMRRWTAAENLPEGSAAGYGVSGASPYPPDNEAGHKLHSLAYLRIPGQQCQYNVWSAISRVHLETILGLLVVIDPTGGR